jgi:hypothetical protein
MVYANWQGADGYMNTGQTFLVIGAFVVLSTLTLNVNASLITTSTTGLEMEATLGAVSIAQSMMDEILNQEFDEMTATGVRVYDAKNLTKFLDLGPDGIDQQIVGDHGVDTSQTNNFESRTRFNDVDDYKGYARKTKNPRFGWFDVTVQVEYVDEDNPDVLSAGRTFYKRVTVKVVHPNLVKDVNNQVVPYVIKDLAVYRRYF